RRRRPRRRPRQPRGADAGLRLLPRDRRARPRRLGLPATRPRGARGDGTTVSSAASSNGGAPGNGPAPGENGSPFSNAAALFGALWRLIRGQDQRGRKVRWLLGLLRPYRGRTGLM